MAQCRTCSAVIVWGITENGKRVPLDPLEKRYIFPGDGDLVVMVDTHLSHFATCPQADQHRKEKPLRGSTEDYLGGNDG
jgi:hypothetical protein